MLVHALADLLYMEVIKMIVWCMCVHAFRGGEATMLRLDFMQKMFLFWAFAVAVAPTGSCAC